MTYLLVGDALGRSMVELLEGPSDGLSFSEWMAGHGSGVGTGFGDDPDRDGIDNGVEAFFGTGPFDPDPGLAVATLVGNALSFTHPQRGQPLTDVSGSYEWSVDLSSWHASGRDSGAVTLAGYSTWSRCSCPRPAGASATCTDDSFVRRSRNLRNETRKSALRHMHPADSAVSKGHSSKNS